MGWRIELTVRRPPLPRICKFKIPREKVLADEAVQVAIIQLWIDGYDQKEIGRVFGYTDSSKVCSIVSSFCVKYVPKRVIRQISPMSEMTGKGIFPDVGREERKRLAWLAVEQYRQKHGQCR